MHLSQSTFYCNLFSLSFPASVMSRMTRLSFREKVQSTKMKVVINERVTITIKKNNSTPESMKVEKAVKVKKCLQRINLVLDGVLSLHGTQRRESSSQLPKSLCNAMQLVLVIMLTVTIKYTQFNSIQTSRNLQTEFSFVKTAFALNLWHVS